MRDDIKVVSEDGFRSKKVELNQANDMIRVTLEMPIDLWRSLKPDLFGFEISHSRRQTDFKKEDTVVCPECGETVLNIYVKEIDGDNTDCKVLIYRCGKCKKDFSTLIMDKENKSRVNIFLKEKKNKNS